MERDKDRQETGTERQGNRMGVLTMIIFKAPAGADLLKIVHRINVDMHWSPAQLFFHTPSSEIYTSFSLVSPEKNIKTEGQ